VLLSPTTVNRRPNGALTHIWCNAVIGTDEACLKEVELATAIHLTLHELEFRDLPYGPAVGPRDKIAVRTASVLRETPFANDATRLSRPRSIQGIRSASALCRIMSWKPVTRVLASTSVGTPVSTAALVTVSAFVSGRGRSSWGARWFEPTAHGGAPLCRLVRPRRRRVAHSVTMRRLEIAVLSGVARVQRRCGIPLFIARPATEDSFPNPKNVASVTT
jgi:hypothetical protein